MIDLLKFCDPLINPKLKKPWTVDNWTYTCNGSLLIRVPKRKEWPDNTGPGIDELSFFSGNKVYHDLILPEKFDWKYCDDDGDFELCGIHECDCQCRWIESRSVVQANGFLLNVQNIYLIKDLPNLKTYFPTYEESLERSLHIAPMYFTFDGGDGLIMGMKK